MFKLFHSDDKIFRILSHFNFHDPLLTFHGYLWVLLLEKEFQQQCLWGHIHCHKRNSFAKQLKWPSQLCTRHDAVSPSTWHKQLVKRLGILHQAHLFVAQHASALAILDTFCPEHHLDQNHLCLQRPEAGKLCTLCLLFGGQIASHGCAEMLTN